MAKLIKAYWFLGGVFAVLLLSHYAADAGTWLDTGHCASNASIVALFIFSGAAVSLRHLGKDLGNWRCHALIWSYSFLLIPLAVFLTAGWLPEGPLKEGVYFVAILPTTISSSVAFTMAAGGSAATSIISSVGANLMGVFLSPLLFGALLGRFDLVAVADTAGTIGNMCLLVLLPFGAGQVIGSALPVLRERMRGTLSLAAQLCVLLLMYCAFSKSLGRLMSQMTAMWQCFAYLAVLQVAIIGGAVWIARRLKLPNQTAAAVVFCSIQKTMAFGLPLAYAYYRKADPAVVGLVIIPLAFYYLLQMISSSVLLHWWLRQPDRT